MMHYVRGNIACVIMLLQVSLQFMQDASLQLKRMTTNMHLAAVLRKHACMIWILQEPLTIAIFSSKSPAILLLEDLATAM